MIVRDLLVKLGFSADTGPLDKTDKKIEGMKGHVSALGIAAGNVLANLVESGVGKAIELVGQGVEASTEFGRGMANVSSLIGGNQARTQELAASVEQLSQKYGASTSNITDGLYDLIGTLGDSSDAVAQLEVAMKLGKAGAATTKDGLAVLSAVTKAYGDTSIATMQKVADLSSQTVNLGKITLPELASSIGVVTPLAATLGVNIEEVMANTATLTGVTGNGAEVMHQMAAAMRSLVDRSKPMEKAFQKAFKKEGITSISEAIGKYGFVGTLQRLVKTTDGTIESVNGLFGRIEGLNEALAVTGKLSGDFVEKSKAMANVSGTVDEQFKAQTTGMGAAAFATDKLKAKSEALDRVIGEKMTSSVMGFNQAGVDLKSLFANGILPMFTGANDIMGDGVQKTDAWAASLEFLQGVALGVASALDLIVSAIRIVGTTFVGLLNAMDRAAHGDFGGALNAIEAAGEDVTNIGAGFGQRFVGRFETPAFGTMLQAEQLATAGGGMMAATNGPTLNSNVGSINVNVTTAPGTEAAAAAREVDASVRNVLQQNLQQAHQALAGDW